MIDEDAADKFQSLGNWIILDTQESGYRCQRCDTFVPIPQLPLEISEFLRQSYKLMEPHRLCKVQANEIN